MHEIIAITHPPDWSGNQMLAFSAAQACMCERGIAQALDPLLWFITRPPRTGWCRANAPTEWGERLLPPGEADKHGGNTYRLWPECAPGSNYAQMSSMVCANTDEGPC